VNPASWIWRPSFERQRDFNPPEQRAAQRALPVASDRREGDLPGRPDPIGTPFFFLGYSCFSTHWKHSSSPTQPAGRSSRVSGVFAPGSRWLDGAGSAPNDRKASKVAPSLTNFKHARYDFLASVSNQWEYHSEAVLFPMCSKTSIAGLPHSRPALVAKVIG